MTGKSHLSDLSHEERELVIGLPWRVGVWMGNAEDEGGDKDDARETAALEKNIGDLARSEKIPVFVRELLKETLARRRQWVGDAGDVLSDCARAVKILDEKCGKADRNNFKKALKKIAYQVAGAHGEFGEIGVDEGSKGFLGRVLGKIKGGPRLDDFMNISPGEEEALRALAAALRTDDDR